MKIEILGTGCPNCKKIEKNVREVIQELKIQAEISKITEISEIMKRGVMSLPALIIDGKLKSSGRILDMDEIKKMLFESKI